MATRLDDAALEQLFLEARTHRAWQPRDVPDAVLRELVDLMKMGPTANNGLPARLVFVKSKAAKERLKPHLTPGNVDKTMSAPAPPPSSATTSSSTSISPRARTRSPVSPTSREQALTYALRNSSLQGAYLILAARALGLDCGPMSGFDNAGVDKEFFAGTEVRSNFLCNLGYGDPAGLRPRGPRFAFDEMAKIYASGIA